MKEIIALKVKQAAGTDLNEDQLAKLSGEESLLAELAQFERDGSLL